MNASQTFDVSLSPQLSHSGDIDGAQLNKMAINKVFASDLTGKSTGEILSAMITTQGSAGFVAIEHVSATLHAKESRFVLQQPTR